ncbi:hypothetical protein FHR72_001187 [Mycolicibacterium iranicum]|uniref:Uncharacterized protein n=1 Tax=Mycolicibacterium iranicum TaxID=912594 RepID=A0A839Q4A1_MYCIR|nr:hypothetical protein [Mycolicibacterium iranicum]MBB2989724.1 hypothetical protein [Mycolicibacterium iranicum]
MSNVAEMKTSEAGGRHVGRVGALALALGVGFAVATATSTSAWAEDGSAAAGPSASSSGTADAGAGTGDESSGFAAHRDESEDDGDDEAPDAGLLDDDVEHLDDEDENTDVRAASSPSGTSDDTHDEELADDQEQEAEQAVTTAEDFGPTPEPEELPAEPTFAGSEIVPIGEAAADPEAPIEPTTPATNAILQTMLAGFRREVSGASQVSKGLAAAGAMAPTAVGLVSERVPEPGSLQLFIDEIVRDLGGFAFASGIGYQINTRDTPEGYTQTSVWERQWWDYPDSDMYIITTRHDWPEGAWFGNDIITKIEVIALNQTITAEIGNYGTHQISMWAVALPEGYFPTEFDNPLDTDGDGIPDSKDLDDDNDGVPDSEEEDDDADDDGTPDEDDEDDDGDGTPDDEDDDADGDGEHDGDQLPFPLNLLITLPDENNPEWEAAFENLVTTVSFVPFIGSVPANAFALLIDTGQLLGSLAAGDLDESWDELKDITGDFVGIFIPTVGKPLVKGIWNGLKNVANRSASDLEHAKVSGRFGAGGSDYIWYLEPKA